MKKLASFFTFFLIVWGLKAQFDADYTFWNMAINPDNEGREAQLRKEGYKKLVIVAYKTDEDEGKQILLGETETVFDAKGKLVSVADKLSPLLTHLQYTYDKRSKVTAFTYTRKGGKEYTMEFTYDRRKGFQNIKTTEPQMEWDTVKFRMVITTDTLIKYIYFGKNSLPEVCINVYQKKGDTKGFGNKDTTFYQYDRNNNIVDYYAIISDKAGRTAWEITGNYTYNEKKQLLKTVINKYDHNYNPDDPKIVEEHTFTYDDGTGQLLLHQKSVRSYYVAGDDVKHDEWFVDTEYAYGDKGLPISHTVTATPGDKKLYVYRYSK